MGASGSGSSVTGSGISGGAVHITDGAKQQALTGKDADQTVASVNRNVSTERDSANALKPIFNEQEIKAGFEITGAFLREGGTFLGNRAKEAQDKERLAKDPNAKNPDGSPLTDEQRLQYAKEAQELKANWGPGGTYRQIATALMAGAGGNVTGGMSNFVQNSAVAYLQELGANQVKQIADALDSDTARAALHAVVGCAGAAASSQSCATGALGAAGGSIINNLLDQLNKGNLTPEEKEARSNLVSSLVAGITAAAGGNAATAANAARIETENNRLATSAEVKRIHQLSQGDPKKEARLTAAACSLIHCEREYPEGSEAYKFYKNLSDIGASDALKDERTLLAAQQGFQIRAGVLRGVDIEPLFAYDWKDKVGDAATRVDNSYQLSTRALGGVQAVGGGTTALAGGSITAGGAAACGPTAGASCLVAAGGAALTFWGLDQAKAGVDTMISGQPQATVGGIVLQQVFGISPQAAEMLYGLAGGTAGIVADAALAKQAATVLGKGAAADASAASSQRGPNLGQYKGADTAADETRFFLTERELKPKQGSLSGPPEMPPKNASDEMIRSIDRQNEAAQILADHGLTVENLPNTGKGVKNPDLKINGQVADVYSPTSGNLQSIRDKVVEKTAEQAPNVVINLADSPLSISDVTQYLQRNPVGRANSVILIKDGRVVSLGG
jgi:filamentous hemagglutinin